MRSRITAAIAAVTALALVLVGCAGLTADAGSDPNNPNQVEVFTWWTSGNEKIELQASWSACSRSRTPTSSSSTPRCAAAAARRRAQAIAARLESNNPPDSFQAAAGAGLTDYIAAGRSRTSRPGTPTNGLSEGVYRAALLELLSVDGKIYSVPSDIHRVNVLWANTSLLEDAGIDPAVAPANIDAWIADLEKVRASGVEYPLALGNDWTQVQLFENVLRRRPRRRAVPEPLEEHEELGGRRPPHRHRPLRAAARVRRAHERLDGVERGDAERRRRQGRVRDHGRLRARLVPAGRRRIRQAVHRVSRRPARSASSTSWPTRSRCRSAPCTTRRRGSGCSRSASAEGQKALSLVKGSIPARTDTVAEDYPPYQQTAIASLQLDTVVPSLAHGVAANPSWTKAITDRRRQVRRATATPRLWSTRSSTPRTPTARRGSFTHSRSPRRSATSSSTAPTGSTAAARARRGADRGCRGRAPAAAGRPRRRRARCARPRGSR